MVGNWDSDPGSMALEALTTKLYSQKTETQEGGLSLFGSKC